MRVRNLSPATQRSPQRGVEVQLGRPLSDHRQLSQRAAGYSRDVWFVHPPPVWLVEIEKNGGGAWRGADGGKDVEPRVEPIFHLDSYGYHPGRSELDAIGVARKRCWEFERIIDLDIKAFFDSIPHDLIEKAVVHHIDLAWVQLYVGRWLRARLNVPTVPLKLISQGYAGQGRAALCCGRLHIISGVPRIDRSNRNEKRGQDRILVQVKSQSMTSEYLAGYRREHRSRPV
jgi:hypothetical protein